MAFKITSPAFKDGDYIDLKYTCDSEDISPELNWSGIPDGTKSFVLICDDPDAPMETWVHWIIYDVPLNINKIPEGISNDKEILGSAKQGKNSWNKIGYGGPCPPGTNPHRYYFKLYALNKVLKENAGLSKENLLKKMKDSIIEECSIMGKYKRK